MTPLFILTNTHVGIALIAVFFALGLYRPRNKKGVHIEDVD